MSEGNASNMLWIMGKVLVFVRFESEERSAEMGSVGAVHRLRGGEER